MSLRPPLGGSLQEAQQRGRTTLAADASARRQRQRIQHIAGRGKGDQVHHPSAHQAQARPRRFLSYHRSSAHRRGLFGRVARHKKKFTEEEKRKRLSFAEGYKHWTPDDWMNVLFADEKMFGAKVSGQIWVRRPKGEAHNPDYCVDQAYPIQSRSTCGVASVARDSATATSSMRTWMASC